MLCKVSERNYRWFIIGTNYYFEPSYIKNKLILKFAKAITIVREDGDVEGWAFENVLVEELLESDWAEDGLKDWLIFHLDLFS